MTCYYFGAAIFGGAAIWNATQINKLNSESQTPLPRYAVRYGFSF
jgi:hypothetical protein